jgi:AraC family transcriptional regulator
MQSTPLTFGNVVTSVTAGDFNILLSSYRPFESHPFHAHDTAAFVYVIDGAVTVRSDSAEQHCPRSSMRFIPAGDRHQTRYGDTAVKCLVMGIGRRRTESVGALNEPTYHAPRAPLTSFAERIRREIIVPDAATPLAVEALMLEMLVSGVRTESKRELACPTWLSRVRERIHSDFRRNLVLTELAAGADVHPVHLSRTFRRYFGCSIADYQRRLRLEWARARLVGSDVPIGRIAIEAGFSDHSEFTRRFVDQTGATPSQFRLGYR